MNVGHVFKYININALYLKIRIYIIRLKMIRLLNFKNALFS